MIMANTILGTFDDPIEARRAMDRLRDSSLKIDDISIVSRATESGGPISNVDDVSAGEGAAVGAVWGGLVGLAALLIPGIGPIVALGALGAALTGAGIGAVVGGITAALIDFSGIPEDEARAYESQVQAGKTLVAVKVAEADTMEARRLLVSAGADSIHDNQTDIAGSSQPARVAMYDTNGRALDRAAEVGGPPNPTTIQRQPFSSPAVDRVPNASQPVIDETAASAQATDNQLSSELGSTGPRSTLDDLDTKGTTPDAGTLPGEASTDTNIPDSEEGLATKL